MVTITQLDNLKADIKLTSTSYDLKQGKATAFFMISVSYGSRVADRAFGVAVNVDEDEQIRILQDTLADKSRIIDEAFEKIKGRISLLLELGTPVEVNLDEIAQKLYETVFPTKKETKM